MVSSHGWRSRRALLVVALACVGALVLVGTIASTATGTPPAQSTDEPTVAFSQTAMGNVFLANETATVDVESDADRMVWVLERYGGERVANGTLSPDRGDRANAARLTLPVDGVGHYELHAWPAGAVGAPTTTTVGVLPADDFDNDDRFYGMSTHFQQGWDHDLMAMLSAAGVASARDEHGWMFVEESRGSYDFAGPEQAGFMGKLADRDLERLFILAYGNPIYGGEWNHAPHDERYRAAFANYSRAAVARYDDLGYVEVWNEYNLETYASGPASTDPDAYAKLLAATYPAVKDERENVTVVGGVTAGVDVEFLEDVLAAGGARHMDVISVHPYRGEPTGYAADVDRLRNLTREYGGEPLPIWATEFGWSTGLDAHTSASRPGQARNLLTAHVRLRTAGVERVFWYTFRDDQPATPNSTSGQWGLVRHPDDPRGGYTPKPSLLAYATMTRHLAGAEPTALDADAPIAAYRYDHGGAEDVPTHVLWRSPDEMTTTVAVRTDAPVTVTTMTGRAQRLVPHDGTVSLTVGSDPLYVEGPIGRITTDAPVGIAGTTDTLELSVTAGDGPRTVTHAVADRSVELTAAAGTTSRERIDLPAAYRPLRPEGAGHVYVDGNLVRDVVSVDGDPVALLSTRVRPAPTTPSNATGETPTGSSTATDAPSSDGGTGTDDRTPSGGPTTDGGETSGTGPGFTVGLTAVAVALAALFGRRQRA